MKAENLQSALINWSVKNSGFEARRPYIGLSHMGECDTKIYDWYCYGYERPKVAGHLQTIWTLEIETAIVDRIVRCGLDYKPADPICLHDGLVQGHPDGWIGRDLLEIKSIPREVFIPERGRIPRRIFWQIQAYLHYTSTKYCNLIFIARDNGMLQVYDIKYQPNIGEEIEDRVERLVKAVLSLSRPSCSCGRCGELVSPNGYKGD
jgi:hypothetical protein